MEISRAAQIYSTGTTATSGDLNGVIVDMSGFDRIAFIAQLSATNASTWLKMQVGTATDAMSDTTGEVAGTVRTLYLDAYRPIKRYVRGVVKGATTTGAYRTLTTLIYAARAEPTTQDASTTGLRVYSPGTGTATG